MATDPKSIRQLTDVGTALVGTDLMAVQDPTSGTVKKSALSRMLTYILGGKTIGGTSAGDILDNNSAQTMTNKTMTSPVFNGGAALVPTSTQVNATYALTADRVVISTGGVPTASAITATELGNLDDATGNIQAQIDSLLGNLDDATGNIQAQIDSLLGNLDDATDNIQAQIDSLLGNLDNAYIARQYNTEFSLGLGETTKNITEATIKTACGLSGYVILTPLTINIWARDGASSFIEHSGHGIKFASQTDSGQVHLEDIDFNDLTASTSYAVSVTFTIAVQAGV